MGSAMLRRLTVFEKAKAFVAILAGTISALATFLVLVPESHDTVRKVAVGIGAGVVVVAAVALAAQARR